MKKGVLLQLIMLSACFVGITYSMKRNQGEKKKTPLKDQIVRYVLERRLSSEMPKGNIDGLVFPKKLVKPKITPELKKKIKKKIKEEMDKEKMRQESEKKTK